MSACPSLSKFSTKLLANSTDTATGFILCGASVPAIDDPTIDAYSITFAYFIISLLLDVFLTLTIVTRLVLHNRNIRSAMGATVEASRLYKSIISILIESCALYAGSFLAYIATRCLGSPSWEIFQFVTAE